MTNAVHKRVGVIGYPVAHSLSPVIFDYWFEQHGIPGTYDLLPVAPDDLENVLAGLADQGYAGVNVTVPHKIAAYQLAEHPSPTARRIGAANVLTVTADGPIAADNTDGYGFVEGVRSQVGQWQSSAGPAVVIGAGGAARAVVDSLVQEGAPEVRVVNRTGERASALAAEFGLPVRAIPWSDMESALTGAATVVNATSLGMRGNPPLEIPLAALPPTAVVADIVYVPLETPLLNAARAAGHAVADGLGMLLHQARPAFERWFGVRPDADAELRAKVLERLAP